MPNEVKAIYQPSKTLYLIVIGPLGKVWNGTILENMDVTHWSQYAVYGTEQAVGTGLYFFNFPTGILTPGRYSLVCYQRLGANPSASDTAVKIGEINWDGQKEVLEQEVALGQLRAAVDKTLRVAQSLGRRI